MRAIKAASHAPVLWIPLPRLLPCKGRGCDGPNTNIYPDSPSAHLSFICQQLSCCFCRLCMAFSVNCYIYRTCSTIVHFHALWGLRVSLVCVASAGPPSFTSIRVRSPIHHPQTTLNRSLSLSSIPKSGTNECLKSTRNLGILWKRHFFCGNPQAQGFDCLHSTRAAMMASYCRAGLFGVGTDSSQRLMVNTWKYQVWTCCVWCWGRSGP